MALSPFEQDGLYFLERSPSIYLGIEKSCSNVLRGILVSLKHHPVETVKSSTYAVAEKAPVSVIDL